MNPVSSNTSVMVGKTSCRYKDKFLNALRLIKRTVLDIPYLLWGLIAFQKNKVTPPKAYQSLIHLYCLTGGYSNALLSSTISVINKPYQMKESSGIEGDLCQAKQKQINTQLNEAGYYIFENKLSPSLCDAILAFAYEAPSTIRGDKVKERQKVVYDPNNLLAVRYDFDPQVIINQSDVQKIMTDPSIITIAQNYLRTKPILDVMSLWWHTAYQKEADAEAAQFFHFDMDRIKWLKFFIYLTDVNPQNGPHVFVRGSHQNNGIPYQLRSKGYARLMDEQIATYYNKSDIIEYCAPKGTIFAEDTRGLHKGQPVIHGDRLVLQLQFSNHLFGSANATVRFTHISENLKQMITHYPKIYQNYL